ncbi:hypothetical protein BpHYR1_016785 [Brachionus plicatilis]|uniref:Uncharacterized protein n=1 Tax=Brachionus plicatilis TaxID=10195 RepID=A0A3M7PNJ1_BRAPC|nr:hypothetical protein BpHYR1_016785 [Brachionus plicatilis]
MKKEEKRFIINCDLFARGPKAHLKGHEKNSANCCQKNENFCVCASKLWLFNMFVCHQIRVNFSSNIGKYLA